jgi:AraC-like DNA-binding protein
MELRFNLSRTLKVQDLRIPVPVLWIPEHGEHRLTAETALRKGPSGTGWTVPAEVLFSFSIEPGVRGRASGTLNLCWQAPEDEAKPDWCALHESYWDIDSTFGATLAREIFTLPEYPWTIEEVSAIVGVSPRELRGRLFRQAYSFSSTLRRCRLLHAFLSALSPDHPSLNLTQTTTRYKHHLDNTFKATHHVALSTISKITLPRVAAGNLLDRLPKPANHAWLFG